jgi:hypothetical protein
MNVQPSWVWKQRVAIAKFMIAYRLRRGIARLPFQWLLKPPAKNVPTKSYPSRRQAYLARLDRPQMPLPPGGDRTE